MRVAPQGKGSEEGVMGSSTDEDMHSIDLGPHKASSAFADMRNAQESCEFATLAGEREGGGGGAGRAANWGELGRLLHSRRHSTVANLFPTVLRLLLCRTTCLPCTRPGYTYLFLALLALLLLLLCTTPMPPPCRCRGPSPPP